MLTNGIDVAVLVESWLHWGIHDDCIYRDILPLGKIEQMAVQAVVF